jgi:hypothetical protein
VVESSVRPVVVVVVAELVVLPVPVVLPVLVVAAVMQQRRLREGADGDLAVSFSR